MAEEDIDLEQQYFNKHGWDFDFHTRRAKTPEQTLTAFNNDPNKFREEIKRESLMKKVKKAFDNSETDKSLPRMFSSDDDISEVIGIEIPESNTQYVTVDDISDLPLLLQVTRAEWWSRRNTGGMNYDQRKRFELLTNNDASDRILKHETMHYNAISEYQRSNPEKVKSVKVGINIKKRGRDESGEIYGVHPFVTFQGKIPLRVYIDMVAAPDDLSESDKEKLSQIESVLKQQGKILGGEDIFNAQDREKIYTRMEQTSTTK